MKNKLFIFATFLLVVLTISFTSCRKHEKLPVKPKITLKEVGKDNSKQAVIGEDMHLEADIVAEGTIKKIVVEIHQEKGGDNKLEKAYTDGKYVGMKNCEFHEHIDIPATFTAGDYHLHFSVVDAKGQSATVGTEIIVMAPAGGM